MGGRCEKRRSQTDWIGVKPNFHLSSDTMLARFDNGDAAKRILAPPPRLRHFSSTRSFAILYDDLVGKVNKMQTELLLL